MSVLNQCARFEIRGPKSICDKELELPFLQGRPIVDNRITDLAVITEIFKDAQLIDASLASGNSLATAVSSLS